MILTLLTYNHPFTYDFHVPKCHDAIITNCGWKKSCTSWVSTILLVVQDFFHPPYDHDTSSAQLWVSTQKSNHGSKGDKERHQRQDDGGFRQLPLAL